MHETIKKWALIVIIMAIVIYMFFWFFFRPYSYVRPDWAEAKAMCGNIGIMLNEYAKLKGESGHYPPSWQEILQVYMPSLEADDLFDKLYFKKESYSWEASYDETLNPPIRYLITVKDYNKKVTFDQNGVFKVYE